MATDRPFRVAHLTVFRDLPSGVRKQLKFEYGAAQAMPDDIEWTTLAVHGGEAKEPFEHRIPPLFRSMFLRNLYGWMTVRRLVREHDAVLLRYMPFDLSAPLMAPLVRERFTVHHSKEVEEMRLIKSGPTGRIASFFDKMIGPMVVRSGRGIVAMTEEIAAYQNARIASTKPSTIYPNGLDPALVPLADDLREEGQCRILFMSDRFSQWHALDRLLDAVAAYEGDLSNVTIDLVGNLSEKQLAHIKSIGEKSRVFAVRGFLEPEAYRQIIASADVGLGSLGLDRQNLSEACILKNREMLGSGLPVYATHRDVGLPEDFPFFFRTQRVDIAELLAFCEAQKAFHRQVVRDSAIAYIDKRELMRTLANWLRGQVAARI